MGLLSVDTLRARRADLERRVRTAAATVAELETEAERRRADLRAGEQDVEGREQSHDEISFGLRTVGYAVIAFFVFVLPIGLTTAAQACNESVCIVSDFEYRATGIVVSTAGSAPPFAICEISIDEAGQGTCAAEVACGNGAKRVFDGLVHCRQVQTGVSCGPGTDEGDRCIRFALVANTEASHGRSSWLALDERERSVVVGAKRTTRISLLGPGEWDGHL